MFKVKIDTENLTDAQNARVQNIQAGLEACVNSIQFDSFVLNFAWQELVVFGYWPFRTKQYQNRNYFRWNNNLSNEQILAKIKSGSETLFPDSDHEADVFLRIDKRNAGNVIGYTSPNVKYQWIYASFFNNSDNANVAMNIFHEWLHKIGFDHEFRDNSLRQYTVPYAIGYFVRDWFKKYWVSA